MEDLIKELENTVNEFKQSGWDTIPVTVVQDWLKSFKEVTGIE